VTDQTSNKYEYAKPNLIIAGCQKSGTTWLHHVLSKSSKIYGSKTKELNYFNKPRRDDLREGYMKNFPIQGGVKYYLESTPHYFQSPDKNNDIANNIKNELNNPKIIVIFRNPVDRYESAYIHHMMQNRIPYSKFINQKTDREKMLSLGLYHEIAKHWLGVFPKIKFMIYDDLVRDPQGFINDVFDYLEIENDIKKEDLMFRTNDKDKKIRELREEWTSMPHMTVSLRNKLKEYYEKDIQLLGQFLDRDLSMWLRATV